MIHIVYWSGTGNTEKMAEAIAEGARSCGAEVSLADVRLADDGILDGDVILFGCPAMGAEQLEESEFEPFFSSLEERLSGKKIGLFGSYDWGDGEWMRLWTERAQSAGAVLIAEGLTAHNAPDEEALAACRALGETALAGKKGTTEVHIAYETTKSRLLERRDFVMP